MRLGLPAPPSTLIIGALLFLDLDGLTVAKRWWTIHHDNRIGLDPAENLNIRTANYTSSHSAAFDSVTFQHKNIFGGVVLPDGFLRHEGHGERFLFLVADPGFVLQKSDLHTHVRKDPGIFGRIKHLDVIRLCNGNANFNGGLLPIGRGNYGTDLGGN